MTLPANIRVNLGAPFPTIVQGSGPITIGKQNGIWTIGVTPAGLLTAQNIANALAASSPTAPAISLFNSTDLTTAAFFGTFYQIEIITNRAGLISQTIQNTSNTNFPSAVNATGWIRAGGQGDQVFGLFGRAVAEVAGGASHELDAYNNSALDAPATVPRGDIFGTTSVWTTALTLAAGSTTGKLNWAALYIVIDPTNPSTQFNYGIYYNPTAVKVTGLFIDADATHSPTTSALIKNTGQGSNVHLSLQTMGAIVAANPVLQHLPAAGALPSFMVNQQGGVLANLNTTLASVPSNFAASFSSFYGVGQDSQSATITLDTYSGAGSFACIAAFRTARGTGGSPSNVSTNDLIGRFSAKAFCNGTFIGQPGAVIDLIYTDPTPATWNGMAIAFGTTPNGTFTRAEAGRFQPSGGLTIGVGTADPGINNLAVAGVYKVAANQVVGARVTGYTAMTGTPDKASAFATSTVTLAQLAGRVMQLQADLTTHGLIGA